MWYNRDLDVFRIQYFPSVVPDVSASGQLNVFSCVRCHNILFILMCISFFVSVG
jgi:hypothetical protein